MQKFFVKTKKTYTNKAGEEKSIWNTIGEITMFDDGKPNLELYMLPDTKLFCFPAEQRPTGQQPVRQALPIEDEPTGENESFEIPF